MEKRVRRWEFCQPSYGELRYSTKKRDGERKRKWKEDRV